MTARDDKHWRKKPVVIEAVRWDGWNLREIIDFTGLHPSANKWTWEEYESVVHKDGLKIFTDEGPMMATAGDWIIRGVKGEFYPCKPDIFALTYERASTPSHALHNPANPERRSSLELSEVKPDGNGNEERSTEVDREGSGRIAIARCAALVAGRAECGTRAAGHEADGVTVEGASAPSTTAFNANEWWTDRGFGNLATPQRIQALASAASATACSKDDVLEEAALVCEARAKDDEYTGGEKAGLHYAAFNIRALKNSPDGGKETNG